MIKLWHVLIGLMSFAAGAVLAVGLVLLTGFPMKIEVIGGDSAMWTELLIYAAVFGGLAVACARFSPTPVPHAVGLVTGAMAYMAVLRWDYGQGWRFFLLGSGILFVAYLIRRRREGHPAQRDGLHDTHITP